MFIIFNKDGSIFSQTQSDFVMQGSNRVNKVFVGFVDNEYSNWSCSGAFNLPNGTRFTIPGVQTQEGFEYLGVKYYGWVIELTNDVTMYSGNVALTVMVVSQNTNVLFTYLANITINETGFPLDGFWDSSITVAQFNDYMAQLAVKLQANTVSVVVSENELPDIGVKNVLYFIIGETSNTPYQVKMWNGSEYTLLGTINLSSFASKEEQLQFETEINAQVEQIRGEVINPFVVVDTISQLPSTNQNKLYIVKETNAWYYWNGSAYVLGGDVIPPQIEAVDVEYDDEYTRLEADNVQEAIEKLAEKDSNLERQVSEKLDKNGYSALAHVGLADNIASPDGITQDTNISFSPTGGTASITDSFAGIKEIKGLTLVVNQLVKNGNFADGTNDWFMQNGTFSVENGICSFSPTNMTSATRLTVKGTLPKVNIGDKCLLLYKAKSNVNLSNISFQGFIATKNLPDLTTQWVENHYFGTATTENALLTFTVYNQSITGIDTYTVEIDYIKVINLTKMFGAGKEPPTVAEFNNLTRNIDTDTYNEGTLLSSRPYTLVSTEFNAFDGELLDGYIDVSGILVPEQNGSKSSANFIPVVCGKEYTFTVDKTTSVKYIIQYDKHQKVISKNAVSTNNPVLKLNDNTYYCRIQFKTEPYDETAKACFHLTHSGYRNGQYEPYVKNIFKLPEGVLNEPLRSAEEAYDSWLKGQIIKRIGIDDLGTLDWNYNASFGIFTCSLPNAKALEDVNGKGNIRCSKYENNNWLVIRDNASNDKQIGINTNGTLYVRDNSYTDQNAFKQAMSGQYLYYELAEPIITEYTDEESWNIPVSDFGTLQAVSLGRNLQIGRYVILYMNNIRDFVRGIGNREDIDYQPENIVSQAQLQAEKVVREQLKEALGGTLRQVLAASTGIDFNNTAWGDLSTFNWYKADNHDGRWETTGLRGLVAIPSSQYDKANIVCSKYATISSYDAYNDTPGISIANDGNIRIFDTSYIDATTLKQSLKGVIIAYKKA